MTRCITQVETAIIMAQKTGLPPAPQEAGADELEHLMGEMLDQDIGVGDFAEAITKRYKVFPR
jgi:hypothetical protein